MTDDDRQIPCFAWPLVGLWLLSAVTGIRIFAYIAVTIVWGIGSARLRLRTMFRSPAGGHKTPLR